VLPFSAVLVSPLAMQQAASLRESGDEMQKLMYKISRNPGKSLYRSAASPGCPELKAWDHKANAQVQDLLTPPEKISAWAPPKDDEALAALHRRRVGLEIARVHAAAWCLVGAWLVPGWCLVLNSRPGVRAC